MNKPLCTVSNLHAAVKFNFVQIVQKQFAVSKVKKYACRYCKLGSSFLLRVNDPLIEFG